MKPILIDISKFGGDAVMPELQKLVDDAYKQGFMDGSRKYCSSVRGMEAPTITFNKDSMTMGEFDWMDDETQSV